jgi:hypothetical protein
VSFGVADKHASAVVDFGPQHANFGGMFVGDGSAAAFFAFETTANPIATDDTPFVFNTALHNVGAGYDVSTGEFTAPTTGVYYFFGDFLIRKVGSGEVAVYLNGIRVGPRAFGYSKLITASSENHHKILTLDYRVSLVAGDKVSLKTYQTTGTCEYYVHNGLSHFGGYQFSTDTSGATPYFHAYNVGGVALSSVGQISFDSTLANAGGHYSTSTGVFTAPVAGEYFFSGSVVLRGASGSISAEITFKKNDDEIHKGFAPASGVAEAFADDALSTRLTLHLEAGDTLSLHLKTMTVVGGADIYTGENLAHFGGHLLSPKF